MIRGAGLSIVEAFNYLDKNHRTIQQSKKH